MVSRLGGLALACSQPPCLILGKWPGRGGSANLNSTGWHPVKMQTKCTLMYCMGEDAEDILASTSLAMNCGYGDFRDEMIRDRIVVGIRDSETAT